MAPGLPRGHRAGGPIAQQKMFDVELLRGRDTRPAALDALEGHTVPIDPAVSLAAAPVLAELLAQDAADVPREQFDRIGLLIARLLTETSDDPSPTFAAAFGCGRLEALNDADATVLSESLRKPPTDLTLEDARSYACWLAYRCPATVRGYMAPLAAADVAFPKYMELWLGERNPISRLVSPSACAPYKCRVRT